MTLFADNFLAGSIISLVMPVTLLTVIWTWYWYSAKRNFGSVGARREARREAAGEPPAAASAPHAGPAATPAPEAGPPAP
jgi:hypothetical protein